MFPMGALAKIVSLIFEGKKQTVGENNLNRSQFTTLREKFTFKF